MKNTMKKSMAVALGTTFIAAMSASPMVNADTNPFGMQNLESGYMQVADGKCGDGKCGSKGESKKAENGEGKCGEGKCGEGMMNQNEDTKKEAKCGEGKMKKEAKCGEGKCGSKN